MHRTLQVLAQMTVIAFILFAGSEASIRAGEIHVAITEDRVEDALSILREKPDLVKENDHQQNKPIHLASLRGATEVVRVCLDLKSQVNARNKFGQTPLHRAMVNGGLEVTKLLVEAGAEVNGRDSQGLTPLHLSAQRRHLAVVDYLLLKGAEYDAPDAFKRRPLHMAIIGSENAVVLSIVKAGADYKYTDSEGNNYLHLAAGGGNPAVTETFLDLGLAVNCTNRAGLTPGHAAAQNGHINALMVLDKHGADFSIKTRTGNMPVDLVKRIRPPYRQRQHDEVQAYLEKWAESRIASSLTNTAPAKAP